MLMLTRKVGEAIVLADNVRLTVVAIQGDKVRIGITAPEDITVDRLEIHGLKNVQRKQRKQAQDAPDEDLPGSPAC
jgi:carbon storage regulator